MKTLFSIVLILLVHRGMSQENVITKFFSEYEGRDDFTTIYITSKMFSMIAQIPEQEDEEDILNIIRKLTGVRVLSTEKYPGANDLYKNAYQLLPKNGFEDLMIVREGNEETKFLVHQNGEVISEFVMITGGDNEFTLISITGDLRLKDISRLSKTMDIKGFDKLEKADDKQ